ncbi:hypothetical protein FIBSPDRAFT_911188 [Athelia psychrophila]|uniref:Uncharacterized protein n=1 Tax=Athelia psychrophila TaxID=1759441 RepID=A0A166IVP9_9AGAM|nr:hypothetical protein FIBSPDRAFT_911188 [Fibularhizoctonia sp. CBS 109695]
MSSNLSALALTSDATIVSQYTPDKYKKTSYYNGITGDDNHLELVYRSDFLTTLFSKPIGRLTHIPVKSLHGVFETPLNDGWDTMPEICDLIKAQKINWSFMDPARFFTHELLVKEEKGSLSPVIIWVGVIPGSTSSNTTHETHHRLRRSRIPDHYSSHSCYRCPGHSHPLVPQKQGQGCNPIDKVYGVSNCHVLCKDTTIKYKHRGSTPKDHIRQGLNEIRKVISDHGILTDLWAQEIIKLEVKERKDTENTRPIYENKAITNLEALCDEVTKYWSNINLHHNIGYVCYATAITVDIKGGTLYTLDWAVFLAIEAKVKDEFEGNIIDLGSKYSPQDLTAMFNPLGGGAITFKVPKERKLRIKGCPTKEDLANPKEFDSEGQCCLIVSKDGNTTNLTVRHYTGLVSFTLNEVGIEFVGLSIYNSGVKNAVAFSTRGGSGCLIRKKFKYTDFYCTTWSA